ncbi:MAG: Bcr/CflA family efflux MFS transporter [Dehalococcoidia bacterium]|nr:Bcr/CflA family efflux MFS transporter [Dehalococcoidia bacterium]
MSEPLVSPVRAPGLAVGALLIALIATAPLSVDMFLPSLPAMTEEFDATEATMQLGVTLFLVAFAGSQLFYGRASDRWGRRPIMFVGLTIFVAGGLLCLTASGAGQLIAGRVLQGLGGGVGPALANAIVLDLYGRARAAKMIGYMSIALPLAPAIAPIIGGFLEEAFGWQSVFVTLSAIGVLLAAAYAVMIPETRPPRDGAGNSLLTDYRTLFSSPTFIGYALVMGLMFGGQLLFISTSSFVLIDRLGLSPTVFGLSFAFVALGLMVGATISSRLVDRMPPRRVVVLGTCTSFVSAGLMAALAWAGVAHPLSVLLPMFAVALGLGMTRPPAMAGALIPFPQFAGLASSMLVFTQMTLSSGYNIAYSQFVEPGVVALATGIFVSVGAALVAVLVLRPGTRGETPSAAGEVARSV